MKEKLRKWKTECFHGVLVNMFNVNEAQRHSYIFEVDMINLEG